MNGPNKKIVLPKEPVTLNVQQIGELNRQLAIMRHDIKGHLCVVVIAADLISRRPEAAKEHAPALQGQTPKIEAAMQTFTAAFEQALGITRL